MKAALERVPCYVCGSETGTPWASENGFDMQRCSTCKLLFVNPRPVLASIDEASQSGMHAGDGTLDVSSRHGGERRIHSYELKLAELYPSDELRASRARWLDVGCGHGEFLEALGRVAGKSLRCVGSEPNRIKAASARSRGLDVTFRDLEAESEGYLYISLLNVYSHLPDPPAFLAKLRRLLEPGGELVLQTGNWAELERADVGDRLNLPDHLSFASEALVRTVLERAGYQVLSVHRYRVLPRGLVRRLARALRSRAGVGTSDLWFRARAVAIAGDAQS
jgi:2-polyprenyl-3-methyl-5-hydroxy-6-metoxy-1,4-benzoquinol methylase